jgi:hypothetical protein
VREVQRQQTHGRERRDRDERQRAEFARDAREGAAVRHFNRRNGSGRELDRVGFGWTRDGYGTSITCTMMNGRLPTLRIKKCLKV